MEQKGDNYHQKVRDGFLALAEKRDDFTVVNAADDIQTVHENVMKAVENIWTLLCPNGYY